MTRSTLPSGENFKAAPLPRWDPGRTAPMRRLHHFRCHRVCVSIVSSSLWLLFLLPPQILYRKSESGTFLTDANHVEIHKALFSGATRQGKHALARPLQRTLGEVGIDKSSWVLTLGPQSLFGIISLQTATELIILALIFNKVTGVYGLLAILTGYQLSFMQLSTYLYSIAVLAALVYLMPHIRRQNPVECLALAWLYIADTIINTFDTAVFGLEWYFANGSPEENENIPEMVAQGIENLRKESAQHGAVVPHETASSMVMIAALTLVRVYFGIVVMSYARDVLQRRMQVLVVEGRSDVVDDKDGPFGRELPGGDGRRGRLGRLMVSVGRGYWLEQQEAEDWMGDTYSMNGAKQAAQLS